LEWLYETLYIYIANYYSDLMIEMEN